MKRTWFMICLVFMLLCVSCSDNGSHDNDIGILNEDQIDYLARSNYSVLDSEGEHYKLYTDSDHSGFYYEIYDTHDRFLDEGFVSWKIHSIEEFDNKVCVTYGSTGGPNFSARYYDVERGRVSPLYLTPLTVWEDNVVLFVNSDEEPIRLVVRDLFDSQTYYQEFFDESFSVSVFLQLPKASFNETGDSVTVTYQTPDEGELTKTFLLPATTSAK